jgi:hypothetical protein
VSNFKDQFMVWTGTKHWHWFWFGWFLSAAVNALRDFQNPAWLGVILWSYCAWYNFKEATATTLSDD